MVRFFLLGLAVVWTCVPSAEACEATSRELSFEVARYRSAYTLMDASGTQDAHDAADALVPCLVELLSVAEAASFHRMKALQAYLDKDADRTVLGFVAALELQPNYRLPTSIAPEGNMRRMRFDEAQARPLSAAEVLPIPPRATLYIDGVQRADRPTERPALLQVLDHKGAIIYTGYVEPDDEPPYWPGSRLPDLDPKRLSAGGGRIHRPLLAVTGGVAVTSAALLTGALVSRARWQRAVDDLDSLSISEESLSAMERRTNTLGYAAQGTGIAALGLGVATIVVSW